MSAPASTVTLSGVSMYVDILSSALDEWVNDLTGLDLIEYALLCREEARAVGPPLEGRSAYTALAAEIAYDRALIALCTERGIDAHATSFAYPTAERQRIETVLRQVGLDLDSPPQRLTSTERPSGAEEDGSTEVHREASAHNEDGRGAPRGSKDAKNTAAASFIGATDLPTAGTPELDQ